MSTREQESREAMDRRFDGLLGALFLFAIAATYSNALHGPFIFDDWHTLQQNPHIRSLANLPRFLVDPDTTSVLHENKDLRPLLVATFALNFAVSRENTWSYHVVNIALHWLAVLLIFRIVRDHLWLGDAARPVAAAAALIAALHPLNSEPVNYLSSRSALLTAVFYLGAFDAAVRGRNFSCLLLSACAMLTKAIAVTLPLVVLVHWLFARRQPAPAARTFPGRLLVGLVAVSAAGILYRRLLLPPWVIESARQPGITPWVYFMTEWSALLYYLRLFLWPDALVIDRLDYPYATSLLAPQAWGSLLVLAALGVVIWRLARERPAFGFAALWFVITLVPESSFFPLAEPVNEHRPYLAMLGLSTFAALGLWTAVGRVARRVQAPPAWLFAVVVAALAGILGSATHARNLTYRDDYTLWLDATEKAPQNPRAWLNAGHAALSLGDDAAARRLLSRGLALSPCYAYLHLNMSALEAREGQPDASLRWAEDAVRCNPGLALARWYRAQAFERMGRNDDALADYRTATEIDAVYEDAWLAQARLLEQRSAWGEAARAYDRSSAADPTNADAAMKAGLLYQYRLGDSAAAAERFRKVLALNPDHYGAHYQLAVALLAANRVDEAASAWRAFVARAHAIGDRQSIDGAPAALRAVAQ
jgi:tetratricopeptide (TPR) repeat protein